MLELVVEAESILTTRQRSLCEFGRLLHESWQIERTLTQKITNSSIDEIYGARPSSGALGGNRWGQGVSGFVRFVVPPAQHRALRPRLRNLRRVSSSFFIWGSHVVVREPEAPHDPTLVRERSLFYA